MTALDDAERLLVSGSFERAKGEAAAARKDARSTSERVAAECVWIQAEYKLGPERWNRPGRRRCPWSHRRRLLARYRAAPGWHPRASLTPGPICSAVAPPARAWRSPWRWNLASVPALGVATCPPGIRLPCRGGRRRRSHRGRHACPPSACLAARASRSPCGVDSVGYVSSVDDGREGRESRGKRRV